MSEIKKISQDIKPAKRTIKVIPRVEVTEQDLDILNQEVMMEYGAKITSILQSIAPLYAELNYEYQKTMAVIDNLNSNIDKIAECLSEAPKKSKKIHYEFSKFGWYLYNLKDYSIRGIEDIYDVINSDLKNKKEYIESIDNFMNEVIEENSEKIINNLVNVFPKCSSIIQDAYNAHKQKLYTLSIPTMLTQIEGISREILGVSIYSKSRDKNEPVAKQRLEKLFKENNIDKDKEGLSYAIDYYPLEVLQSLIIKIDDIDIKYENNEIYSTFNRHKVIHGFDTEYNNKTNSNKCIAMLGYLYNLKKSLEYDIK